MIYSLKSIDEFFKLFEIKKEEKLYLISHIIMMFNFLK